MKKKKVNGREAAGASKKKTLELKKISTPNKKYQSPVSDNKIATPSASKRKNL